MSETNPRRRRLPVLPLRDLVIFPGVTAPIGAVHQWQKRSTESRATLFIKNARPLRQAPSVAQRASICLAVATRPRAPSGIHAFQACREGRLPAVLEGWKPSIPGRQDAVVPWWSLPNRR